MEKDNYVDCTEAEEIASLISWANDFDGRLGFDIVLYDGNGDRLGNIASIPGQDGYGWYPNAE